jgi:hypothetical protein
MDLVLELVAGSCPPVILCNGVSAPGPILKARTTPLGPHRLDGGSVFVDSRPSIGILLQHPRRQQPASASSVSHCFSSPLVDPATGYGKLAAGAAAGNLATSHVLVITCSAAGSNAGISRARRLFPSLVPRKWPNGHRVGGLAGLHGTFRH